MKEQIQIPRDEAALKILDDAELEAATGGATAVVDALGCACACGETACAGSGGAGGALPIAQ